MDQGELETILNTDLDPLYAGDHAVIKVDIAERTLCARMSTGSRVAIARAGC